MPNKNIAQWNLIYYEMADIHRLDKEYTGCTDGEGGPLPIIEKCYLWWWDIDQDRKMLAIFEKYGNPLSSDAFTVFYNFVSK